jgi:hypothetical protein
MTDVTATPRRAHHRAKRLGLAGAAVIVLLAVLVWWLFIRDSGPSPGPLTAPGSEWVSIFQHPGDEFGYGFGLAYNTGEEPATLKRIRLVEPTPGLEVIETAVGGPDRKLLTLDATFSWPSDEFTDQHPVAGYRVAPQSEPAGERGVELLFGLRVGKLGTYQARAIAVEYTVGGSEHVAYIRRGVKICVVPDGEPLEGDCGVPSGMNAPINEH